jgi:hypothetical protein
MRRHGNKQSVEAEFLRAEQLLLLSLHPESPAMSLPSNPSPHDPKSSWAEPGWHIKLDVPKSGSLRNQILPRTHWEQSQFNESDLTPGRQIAYLLAPRHLKTLMNPLSDFSKRRLVFAMNFYL